MSDEMSKANSPSASCSRWFADSEAWTVREVECPDGDHPALDAEGRTIYSNTHYKKRGDAIDNLKRESAAWISLAARKLERLEAEILATHKEAAAAVVAAHKVSEIKEANAEVCHRPTEPE